MKASRNNHAMRDVLAFLFRHWRREAWLVAGVSAAMLTATVADLFMPVFAGRLVDAVANACRTRLCRVQGAGAARGAMGAGQHGRAGRGAGGRAVLRAGGHLHLTLRLMSRLARDAFWRVQRFSTDWHANNFAGSIVRRVTRGMWAVDMMDDTLLLALLPALLVLVGSSVLLGWHWPAMGAVVGHGRCALCRALGRVVALLRCAGGTALQRAGHAGGRRHGRCRDLQRRW